VSLFFRTDLVERVADCVPLCCADIETGEIMWANRPLEEMFGYAVRGELVGRHLDDLLPAEERAQNQLDRRDYASHIRDRPLGYGLPTRGLHTDGHSFPICVGLSGAVVAERRCVIVTVLTLDGTPPPLLPALPLAGE
jgi:PAS domain S-box-containing protein